MGNLGAWLTHAIDWTVAAYPDSVANANRRHDVGQVLRPVLDSWDQKPGAWFRVIETEAPRIRGEYSYPTDGYVVSSVPTALTFVLRARGTFEQVVSGAVRLGGDTDTVGAMVGGMVGAASGLGAISEDCFGFPGADDLIAWAEGLAGERDLATLPDLLDLEARLGMQIGHVLE